MIEEDIHTQTRIYTHTDKRHRHRHAPSLRNHELDLPPVFYFGGEVDESDEEDNVEANDDLEDEGPGCVCVCVCCVCGVERSVSVRVNVSVVRKGRKEEKDNVLVHTHDFTSKYCLHTSHMYNIHTHTDRRHTYM
jgi:hypothetical protein